MIHFYKSNLLKERYYKYSFNNWLVNRILWINVRYNSNLACVKSFLDLVQNYVVIACAQYAKIRRSWTKWFHNNWEIPVLIVKKKIHWLQLPVINRNKALQCMFNWWNFPSRKPFFWYRYLFNGSVENKLVTVSAIDCLRKPDTNSRTFSLVLSKVRNSSCYKHDLVQRYHIFCCIGFGSTGLPYTIIIPKHTQ